MWKIEEYAPESDSWETVAVASSRRLANEWCQSRKKWRQTNLFVEEVEFIG